MSGIELVELSLEVSKILWKYMEAVVKVDKTIEDLKLQVDGLARVLQDLNAVLGCPEFHSLSLPGSEGLRQNIPELYKNCHSTLRETEELVKDLGTSGKDNVWKKNWRAMKLLSSHGDIEDVLSQLKTHSMNLQMAITTANLMISIHSPRSLMSAQTQHFEKLEQMLVAIADHLSPAVKPAEPGGSSFKNKIRQDSDTKTLRTCAMQAISSASTMAGMSVSGRTLVTDDKPAFDFINGEKPSTSTTSVIKRKPVAPTAFYQESTTGSEYGAPLDDQKSSQVQEWIKGSSPLATPPEIPDSPQFLVREQSSGTTTQNSVGSGLASIFGGWSLGGARQSSEPSSLFKDASDDEGEEFEIAQRKFRRASEQLTSNNLSSASRFFQEGFGFVDKLSPRSQEKLDVLGMKLKFATDCSPIVGASLSESTLLEVMQTPPTSATLLERTLAATHQMAAFKLEQNQLDAAESFCRQALKGRRQARSIGNKHPDYYVSLKLLVDILSAKKDFTGARDHADLLPPEIKGDLDRRLAILQSMQDPRDPRNVELTPPPLPIRSRSPVRYPQREMNTAR